MLIYLGISISSGSLDLGLKSVSRSEEDWTCKFFLDGFPKLPRDTVARFPRVVVATLTLGLTVGSNAGLEAETVGRLPPTTSDVAPKSS